MIQLRKYQKQIIDDVGFEFREKNRVCAVAPCGAGKTITVGWMAQATAVKNRRTLFLVHRQELIKQSIDTFAAMHIRHGVIATKYARDYEPLVQIGSVQTVARRLNEIPAPEFIVIDECFVAGTRIDGKAIELLQVGERVSCFDEKTKQIHFSTVTRVLKKPAPDTLIKITVKGRSIFCTGNHPVFTPTGWVQAEDIRKGDGVYVCVPSMRRPQKNSEVSTVSGFLPQRNGTKKLFNCSRKNAHAKSDVRCAGQRKGWKNITSNATQTRSARRQWKRPNQAAADVGASARMGQTGIRDLSRLKNDRARLCAPLQNRYCQPRTKNCNRSGRKFTLYARETDGGYKEGSFIEIARVDCVEIYQRTDRKRFEEVCPDGYVYNIEVEKYHTYFANGIAVHNCHHSTASTWRKILERFPAAKVLGVTATPERLGGHGLGDIFEALVIGPSVKELVAWGNLAPYQYYAPPAKFDANEVRIKFGEYVRADLEMQMDQSTVIGNVIDNYNKLAAGRRAVCYCVSLAHSRHIAASFCDAGIAAMHIDGETPEAIRAQAVEDFRRGKLQILCNVDLISEGFDVPAMEAVILARPTQSLTLYIQQSMRAMRPDKNNPNKRAVIIDHVGNVFRHGMPDEDREWTLATKKKKPKQTREIAIKTCPQCYGTHYAAQECPLCGFVYPAAARDDMPDERDGKLIKIEDVERRARRQEVGRARTVEELERIAIQRGYSLRWVLHMAEAKGLRRVGNVGT